MAWPKFPKWPTRHLWPRWPVWPSRLDEQLRPPPGPSLQQHPDDLRPDVSEGERSRSSDQNSRTKDL